MRISRRGALKTSLLGGLAGGLSGCATSSMSKPHADLSGAQFLHGVASGEPMTNGFLIWTRVSLPDGVSGDVPVAYEVAIDLDFERIVARGKTRTSGVRDWTVKSEVQDLKPGQVYHYRFRVGETVSPIGRSQTLPAGAVDKARFAVVSCSNYAFGHFNVYDAISRRDDIDAVIHLGDYIYEYGIDGYGGEVSKQIGREHVPSHEIITLADYRARHAQYKSDPGSIAMHSAHALIPIWDDHETSNDSWKAGAENHDLSEGDWDERRSAALRAYYEWMPVRDPKPGIAAEALLRTFQWGDLLTLATLETRLMARSEPLNYDTVGPTLTTPEGVAQFKTIDLVDERRELLGQPQAAALKTTMTQSVQSGTRWRLIANQIIMAEVQAPNLMPLINSPSIVALAKQVPQIRDYIALTTLDVPLNLDAWDGYPAARERFYDMMTAAGASDLIVLTGDTHEWWANELFAKDGRRMGVELATSAVTSPGGSAYFGEDAATYSRQLNERNAMVRHHNPFGKGYIDLSIGRDSARADFVRVDTILTTDYTAMVDVSFNIARQNGSVVLDAL